MDKTSIINYWNQFFDEGNSINVTDPSTLVRIRQYINVKVLNSGLEGNIHKQGKTIIMDDGDDTRPIKSVYPARRLLECLEFIPELEGK